MYDNHWKNDNHSKDKMATLQEMMAKLAKLNLQIEEIKSRETAEAVEKVRSLMLEHGLTTADLADASRVKGPKTGVAKGKGGKVAAKYRNTATGESWSGRGLRPKWLKAAIAAGKSIEEFAV